MMKCKLVCAFVCLVSVTGAAFGGEKPWVEVKSPHFRVLTDGGPGEARLVAKEFEDFRALMATRYPNFKLESGAPLTIFAARDEETAKSLNPGVWKMKGEKPAGLYRRSWEKQFAMVRLDAWGRGAQPGVFYEYAALVLSLNSRWTPVWLNVGFNEFYSYTTFTEDKAYIGAPSARLKLLKSMHVAPIPVETLIAVNGRSSYMHDSEDIQRFYAESWLLFHYLMMSPEMGNGAKLQEFFEMLQNGAKQKDAFQQVFGTFKSMDGALQKYLDRNNLPAAQMNNPTRYNEKDFSVRTMTMAETQAELGGYHLWTRDWDNARDYVKDALTNDPNLGVAHEEQGFLYLHDGKDSDALPEFQKALDRDNTLFLSQFFKTMMSPQATSDLKADQSVLRQGLTDTLNLNMQFAPAFIQLSWLSVRQNDLKTALSYAARAEALEPSRAGYHTYTGQILLRMGKYAEAAERARFVADRWVAADHNEAYELWQSIPEADRPSGDPINEDRPKESQRVEGILKTTTCGDRAQRSLTVLQGNEADTFREGERLTWGYSDTFWAGQNHISLCHGLEGKRTIVFYKAGHQGDSIGEVMEVEVRNDLPPTAAAAAGSTAP
jgi:tetratricopeptide (TPR) repeat protein